MKARRISRAQEIRAICETGRVHVRGSCMYRSNKRPAKNCRGCRSKPPTVGGGAIPREEKTRRERGCVERGGRAVLAKVLAEYRGWVLPRGCYGGKKNNRSMLQCSGGLSDPCLPTTRNGNVSKLPRGCSGEEGDEGLQRMQQR